MTKGRNFSLSFAKLNAVWYAVVSYSKEKCGHTVKLSCDFFVFENFNKKY